MIKIYDDKKGREDSFEATIELKCNFTSDPTGYGRNPVEAKNELIKKVKIYIELLKEEIQSPPVKIRARVWRVQH